MKQLSQLCLPDDHTFISEHTNQITAHVETLSDSTKARCNLLDNRLQSWQAFPNQEAKNVQEFLDNVAKEIGVEDEEEEEELSGEELLEKLKQLEVHFSTLHNILSSDHLYQVLVCAFLFTFEANNFLVTFL